MKEYPIIFNGEMVRAILEGKKTQTRRVISFPLNHIHPPYGYPGDNLWVRETWGIGTRPHPHDGWFDGVEYRADEFYLEDHDDLPCNRISDDIEYEKYDTGRWYPSIHMPRWASRIDLSIKDIRVERIQDISEEDAISEGIDKSGTFWKDYRKGGMKQAMLQDPIDSFRTLWNLINEKRGFGWDVNPWVWVIEWPPLSDNQ